MNKTKAVRVHLRESELPTQWYNVKADLPAPLPPPKDPDEGPSRIELMSRIQPKALQEQENSDQRWTDIPKDVQQKYLMVGRPTLLQRATRLEEYLQTPARIYVKREDLCGTGSFKTNTSIPQVYYAKLEAYEGAVSETGAGQWGSALGLACTLYGMRCVIYMARVSYHQKPYRRILMRLFNTEVFPSPSERTRVGREILAQNPNHPGSIGCAIGESIETASDDPTLAYLCGSNLAHVLSHQTVIGLETKHQLKLAGEKADILVACVGGGSNLAGFMMPFLPDRLNGEGIRFLGAESDAAPRLTRGQYRYDHGDPAGLTPLLKSYTLGKDYTPPPVHVGGLRQHSGSPVVGLLRHLGLLDAVAYSEKEAFEAGWLFAKLEGLVPAPETCFAIKAVIDCALEARHAREKKMIVTCFSGHGLLDLGGYDAVFFSEETSLADSMSDHVPNQLWMDQ